jgi:uncharacterized membrane protein
MNDDLVFGLTLTTAVGCGLIGGVFFAFSTFVMAGLKRLPPAQGIAGMQSINVTAISPLFMLALFGTALGCIALAVGSVAGWGESRTVYVLVGTGLYLVGTIVVTMVFNVPRNDALAAVAPESSEGASLWATYLDSWTAWNHVRTISSLAAAVSFVLALRG